MRANKQTPKPKAKKMRANHQTQPKPQNPTKPFQRQASHESLPKP
jgi:hypothetical protein